MKRCIKMATLMGVIALASCDSGQDGINSVVSTAAEPAGDNCANGGTRLDVGPDTNANGILDSDEITESAYTCTGSGGTDGEGFTSIVDTSDEPAGDNCADGGQRIDFGIDDNADGVLDEAEIDGTTFVCNGATGDNGQASLIATTDEPAGDNCVVGGIRIDVGVDTSADGVLDADEITNTSFVCDVPNPVNLSLQLLDFGNGAPLTGVAIDIAGDSVTTDGSGISSFTIVPQEIEALASPVGYPATRLTRFVGTTDTGTGYLIPSNATLAGLSAALSIPLDPNKSIVAISVQDNDPNTSSTFTSLAGVTIDLDVNYDVALVRNSGAALGLSVGNTTLAGSISNVIFINVDPGAITPTFTPPAGYSCNFGWDTFQSDAAGYNVSSYHCAQ